MSQISKELRLDSDLNTVTDVITVREPGEDGDKWILHELTDEAGVIRLVEWADEEVTLYRRLTSDGSEEVRPEVVWELTDEAVSLMSERAGESRKATYVEGSGPGGECYLRIDEELWIMEDYLVSYGPQEEQWLARSRTAARDLTPFTMTDDPLAGESSSTTGWVFIALIFLLGVIELMITRVHFSWIYGVIGALAMIAAGLTKVRRATITLGGAYAAWLLSGAFAPRLLGALPALAELSPAQNQLLWALILLAWFLILRILTHRLFYVMGDATALAGVLAVLLFSLGLLLVSCADEDLSWVSSWRWYFQSSPYRYIWLVLWVGLAIYYFFDYRRVPLTRRGFMFLRERVVRALAAEDPLARPRLIGDGADDLADALHLCDDHAVRRLSTYREPLGQVAAAFRALAKERVTLAQLGPLADQVREDLRLLSEELSKMAPGGPGLRLSPVLKLLASENPDRREWILDRR